MGGRGSSSGNVSKLPKLEGSEKQVKWANDIRDNVVKIIKAESKVFAQNKEFFNDKYGDTNEKYEDYKKYSKQALKVTEASKWIESFRNVQYKTNSYINSLNKSTETTNTGYRAQIIENMRIASTAYEKFIKK